MKYGRVMTLCSILSCLLNLGNVDGMLDRGNDNNINENQNAPSVVERTENNGEEEEDASMNMFLERIEQIRKLFLNEVSNFLANKAIVDHVGAGPALPGLPPNLAGRSFALGAHPSPEFLRPNVDNADNADNADYEDDEDDVKAGPVRRLEGVLTFAEIFDRFLNANADDLRAGQLPEQEAHQSPEFLRPNAGNEDYVEESSVRRLEGTPTLAEVFDLFLNEDYVGAGRPFALGAHPLPEFPRLNAGNAGNADNVDHVEAYQLPAQETHQPSVFQPRVPAVTQRNEVENAVRQQDEYLENLKKQQS